MLESKNRRTTIQLMLTHEDAMMAMLKKFPDGAVKLLQKSSKQAMALLGQLSVDTIEVCSVENNRC